MRPHLHAVKDEAPRIDEILRDAISELDEAENTAARLRAAISAHGRDLARKRGLAFIRFEHLRQEFGRP